MKGIAVNSQKQKVKSHEVALPAVVENVTIVTGLESVDMKLD
jgi:hypothetical protein